MKIKRCQWSEGKERYEAYHDEEWGVPVKEDSKMFEFLILESFQAGLSWYTILSKRENFRQAFDQFDYNKIAQYGEEKIVELMQNKGIVRNRKKIEATINNAQRYQEIQKEFGTFCTYIWAFVNDQPIQNHWKKHADIPTQTEISDALAKDLKKRGFKFLGSTTLYAHMQATGMVNDHVVDCFRYKELL